MKSVRKNKILVIGANGYIGRHVAKALSLRDYSFHLADKGSNSIDGFKNYSQIDILDPDSFESLLPEHNVIFHFAGRTGTFEGFKDFKSFLQLNDMGLLNLLDNVRKKKSQARIIFPSSRLVYKGQKDKPLKESDEKEFRTVYAMNKFSCENYLKMYHDSFGITYTVFRICVPYGNTIDNTMSFGTFSHMVSRAMKGEEIILFGDGSQKRTLIHIQDLAEIIILGGLNPNTENDVFNIGGPEVLSIREIAEQIAKACNVNTKFIPFPMEHFAIETGDTIFDSSKLMKKIEYKYKYKFSSWIASLNKK